MSAASISHISWSMYNSFSCAHQYYKISIYEQKTLTNLHYMDQETDNKYKQTEIYNPFLHKRIKSHKSTTLQCIVNVQVWNLYTVYVLSNKNWNSSNPFLHANPSSKQQKRYTQHNHFQNPQSLTSCRVILNSTSCIRAKSAALPVHDKRYVTNLQNSTFKSYSLVCPKFRANLSFSNGSKLRIQFLPKPMCQIRR